MKLTSRKRDAISLVEVLIVIAIIAILLAILIPAIQKARLAAAQASSMNNHKQNILATHHYSDVNQGYLPAYSSSPTSTRSTWVLILPFLEQGVAEKMILLGKNIPISTYIDPSDPSLSLMDHPDAAYSATSYAANIELFLGYRTGRSQFRLSTISDGSSNTIAFAQHYAFCHVNVNAKTIYSGGFPAHFDYVFPRWSSPIRRATFAELGVDSYPRINYKNRGVTLGSQTSYEDRVTFQMQPATYMCDSRFPQAIYPAGLLVALADGSVRQIAPNISESTFWGAVTPAGGEVLGSDW